MVYSTSGEAAAAAEAFIGLPFNNTCLRNTFHENAPKWAMKANNSASGQLNQLPLAQGALENVMAIP